ncbi:MAG: TPM domain-containing protein [Chitinophagaceae bacterium]
MKRLHDIHKFLLVILTTWLLVLNAIGQKLPSKPSPPRLVNDLAHILSTDQQTELEHKLVALDDSTSNQIAVVTINTLDGYPIEDYANKLFRAWGIGNKATNNGVLVLVSVADRQFRIEVGYGLEGAIPDVTVSDIMARVMVPYFKQGDYYTGIDKATDTLAAAAAGEYHTARERSDDDMDGGTAVLIFIVLVVIIILIVRRGGGGSGGVMSRRGSGSWLPPIWFGGGGSSFGGGFGGGSGGGFGGFGGGSSGGGGASGSW